MQSVARMSASDIGETLASRIAAAHAGSGWVSLAAVVNWANVR
jgi:hypothetical protein